MSEEKKVNRRDYLKYTGAAIGGLVVGGALGYLTAPGKVIEKTITAPGVAATTTVEKTVTITAPPTPVKPKYTFYMVTHGTPGCPFWTVVQRGGEEAAKLYGVKLVYLCPEVFDVKKVAELLESAVAAKPDGLVCPITDPTVFEPILRKAVEEGIPFICHNVADLRPIPEKEKIPYMAYIGEDSYKCGYVLMKHTIEKMKKKGVKPVHVLFGVHEAGNVVHETRAQGSIDALKEEYPEATYEKVIVTYDLTKVKEITKSYLAAHPETNIISNFNSVVGYTSYLAAKEAGRKPGVDIFCHTHDLSPELVEPIKKGEYAGCVGQQQYLQGYLPVVFLYLYKEHGFKPVGTISTGPFIADETNVDEVAERVKAGYGF